MNPKVDVSKEEKSSHIDSVFNDLSTGFSGEPYVKIKIKEDKTGETRDYDDLNNSEKKQIDIEIRKARNNLKK